MKKISIILREKGLIECDSIYEIDSISQLVIIKEFLDNDPEFIALDSRGHSMYSVGLKNYLRFVNGESVFDNKEALLVMDTPLAVKEKKVIVSKQNIRDSVIKQQVIMSSGYHCECDLEHKTFISKVNNKQFMEGHHLIPLKHQGKFNYSLDIYANVISVCPICHRLLHYGLDDDKRLLLEKLYFERKERLYKSGILISKEKFLGLSVE